MFDWLIDLFICYLSSFLAGIGKKVIRKDSLAIHLEAKRTGRRLSEVRVGREIVPDQGRKAELSEIGNRLQRYAHVSPCLLRFFCTFMCVCLAGSNE